MDERAVCGKGRRGGIRRARVGLPVYIYLLNQLENNKFRLPGFTQTNGVIGISLALQ